MGLNKDKLIFDPADLTDSDDVGAYVRSSDGTLITHTNVGGKDGLDVNVINPITVASASDRAEDSAHTSGDVGSYVLAVRQDTLASSTSADGDYASFKVDAQGSLYVTDPALKASLDSVIKVDNAAFTDGVSSGVAIFGVDDANTYQPFKMNAAGELLVAADISVVTGSDKAEDSAHASGDIGAYVLSVRQDVLASSTSASGDYQSMKTDALGRMYINDARQSAVFSAVSVTDTATDLVAADLANRASIIVQNISNKSIYLGNSGVTTATGIKLNAGSSIELDVSSSVDLFAIADTGVTAAVRILELA